LRQQIATAVSSEDAAVKMVRWLNKEDNSYHTQLTTLLLTDSQVVKEGKIVRLTEQYHLEELLTLSTTYAIPIARLMGQLSSNS
jgi:hypothetical protein